MQTWTLFLNFASHGQFDPPLTLPNTIRVNYVSSSTFSAYESTLGYSIDSNVSLKITLNCTPNAYIFGLGYNTCRTRYTNWLLFKLYCRVLQYKYFKLNNENKSVWLAECWENSPKWTWKGRNESKQTTIGAPKYSTENLIPYKRNVFFF